MGSEMCIRDRSILVLEMKSFPYNISSYPLEILIMTKSSLLVLKLLLANVVVELVGVNSSLHVRYSSSLDNGNCCCCCCWLNESINTSSTPIVLGTDKFPLLMLMLLLLFNNRISLSGLLLPLSLIFVIGNVLLLSLCSDRKSWINFLSPFFCLFITAFPPAVIVFFVSASFLSYGEDFVFVLLSSSSPVSYTHLTLPTKRIV